MTWNVSLEIINTAYSVIKEELKEELKKSTFTSQVEAETRDEALIRVGMQINNFNKHFLDDMTFTKIKVEKE